MPPIDHSEVTSTKKREIAHCQRIHAQKLEAIRSRKMGTGTLDNRLPETAKMKHLKLKLKKLQLQEDRYNEIEHENKLLLQKMSRIITKHSDQFVPSEVPQAKSLNSRSRKWQLMKVSAENKAILERLEKAKPTFDAAEWKSKRSEEEARLKRLQKVHYTPPPPPQNLHAIAATEIKKLHRDVDASEHSDKVRDIIELSHGDNFYKKGHMIDKPPVVAHVFACDKPAKSARGKGKASTAPALSTSSSAPATANAKAQQEQDAKLDALLAERARAEKSALSAADAAPDLSAEEKAAIDADFDQLLGDPKAKKETEAAETQAEAPAAAASVKSEEVSQSDMTDEEKNFHDRKQLLYEVKQEIDILDDDGKYCGSVLMAVEAKEKGNGEVEVTARPLVEGEHRVAQTTRLAARMPTLALVDPDAATSFAKAMVKGIKMKVDNNDGDDDEEDEDATAEDEEEGEGESLGTAGDSFSAKPLPMPARQKRRTSLFAASGRTVKTADEA